MISELNNTQATINNFADTYGIAQLLVDAENNSSQYQEDLTNINLRQNTAEANMQAVNQYAATQTTTLAQFNTAYDQAVDHASLMQTIEEEKQAIYEFKQDISDQATEGHLQTYSDMQIAIEQALTSYTPRF